MDIITNISYILVFLGMLMVLAQPLITVFMYEKVRKLELGKYAVRLILPLMLGCTMLVYGVHLAGIINQGKPKDVIFLEEGKYQKVASIYEYDLTIVKSLDKSGPDSVMLVKGLQLYLDQIREADGAGKVTFFTFSRGREDDENMM